MATLQMTKQQTTPTQTPLHESRATQAMTSDPGKALQLAPSLQPDVDLLTTEGLPVASEWLAREAHIGYHAVVTFLQEQRGASQSEAEQAHAQERPTVLPGVEKKRDGDGEQAISPVPR